MPGRKPAQKRAAAGRKRGCADDASSTSSSACSSSSAEAASSAEASSSAYSGSTSGSSSCVSFSSSSSPKRKRPKKAAKKSAKKAAKKGAKKAVSKGAPRRGGPLPKAAAVARPKPKVPRHRDRALAVLCGTARSYVKIAEGKGPAAIAWARLLVSAGADAGQAVVVAQCDGDAVAGAAAPPQPPAGRAG